jgi:ABC-type Fe3+/spermidine/putrescine transport system ATPase subunit
MRDNDLELKGVSRVAADLPPLAPLDLTVAAGEHVALVERGEGAARTLMRIAAGFARPDIGRVVFAGRDLTDRPPGDRPTRWVGPDLGLFAESVVEDVALGLPADVFGRPARRERALALLARHDRAPLADRPADGLAPEDAVLVALLRAVAGRPRVLLLDRPFLGVPVGARPALRDAVEALRRDTGAAVLERCDDPGEALARADRVALFERDRLVQVGTPDGLRSAPVSLAAACLTGPIDALPGRLLARDGEIVRVETPLGSWRGRLTADAAIGAPVTVAFRPERLDLVDRDPLADRPLNRFDADFLDRRLEGPTVRLRFAAAGVVVVARRLDRGPERQPLGARATLGIAVDDTWILPAAPLANPEGTHVDD